MKTKNNLPSWGDIFDVVWRMCISFLVIILSVEFLPRLVENQNKLVEYVFVFCVIVIALNWIFAFTKLNKVEKENVKT